MSMASDSQPIARCGDHDRIAILVEGMMRVCAGEQAIDVISASHSVAVYLIGLTSQDLPGALDNADRLCADMKDELRRRLGN